MPNTFYYKHAEKYSPKTYGVKFYTQMSSSQSEEWTMFFTGGKNDTSNQNRERCFFPCEKNNTPNQKSQRCVSFAPKFPPFIGACSLQRPLALRELRRHSTRKVFLVKNEKYLGNWSGMILCISLSMKRIVESRLNNSGRWKRKRDSSLSCTFDRSYFT